ncbi:MAG: hypothetical protein WHS46_08445 [Desulfosoma sp.]
MKHRDFLKATAVGVTWISTEAAIGALEATAKLSQAVTSYGRNTTVFHTDLLLKVDAPMPFCGGTSTPLQDFSLS